MTKATASLLTEDLSPIRQSPQSGDGCAEPEGSVSTHPGPELSIIVPTFNERENVAELIRRLDHCLTRCPWEVIFVDDDSPDGTASFVRELAQRDSRIR